MNDVDFSQLAKQISNFLIRYGSSLYEIARHNTNVFEAFCFVIFVRHYEAAGYELRPENLLEGKFRFKYNTRGYPWNYSYFVAVFHESEGQGDTILFEIRHNQQVAGAWIETEEHTDPPMFALDIAVTKPNCFPDMKRGQKRNRQKYWVGNNQLLTFGEAKKLTAYPMLLAQFLGIVHEVKPEFLQPEKLDNLETILGQRHPPPILFTANHLSSVDHDNGSKLRMEGLSGAEQKAHNHR